MSAIRALNDAFRQTFIGGKIMLAAGVATLPPETKGEIVRRVRAFSTFNEDNDPHGEHDFGSFDVNGEKFFWKIDYYDLSMECGSEDPADPNKTARVLTILRADEY